MPNRRPGARRWTYAQSGVDRSEIARALGRLLAATRYRAPASHGRPLTAVGHYAGIVRVGRETIAITTDTVGTKVLLAEQLGRFEEVGEDAVAINVNDLAAVGARAVGLVDVINCARPDPTTFAALGRGIARGLRRARCHLLGGETAVVPEIVPGLDLGGTAIGFFPAGRRPITGARIRPGDRILGFPASGFHANGYTLLRRILERSGVDLRRPRPGGRRPLGTELLTPTRTYSEAVEAIADDRGTHGLAHITGGGVRNLVRLHRSVAFVLDGWPAPRGIYSWLRDLGSIADAELYQTFNMGIGFAAIVAPEARDRALAAVRRAGYPEAREIGHVERGRGVQLPGLDLSYEGYGATTASPTRGPRR